MGLRKTKAAPPEVTMATQPPSEVISKALLLDLFDEPIVFHRAYVPVTGSVTAALWLANVINRSDELDWDDDGWFEKTAESVTTDTGLTRFEQETARRCLRDRCLIEERKVGMPARLQYRVNRHRLTECLQTQATERWKDVL